MSRNARWHVGIALVVVLTVSACGGTSGTDDDARDGATPDGSVTSRTSDTGGADEASSDDGDPEVGDTEFADDPFSPDAAYNDFASGPMNEFMGYDEFDPAKAEEQYLQQERERQEIIAACMHEQGWEYTPFVYEADFGFSDPFEGMTRREYAEKYGFGYATMMDDPAFNAPPPTDQPVDPNQTYAESLSEVEREAYYETLYGGGHGEAIPIEELGESVSASTAAASDDGAVTEDAVTEDAVSEETVTEETVTEDSVTEDSVSEEAVTQETAIAVGGTEVFEGPQGCQGEAYEQESQVDPADDEFMTGVYERMNEIYQRMSSDSRVVQATKGYVECMTAAGFPEISTKEDIYQELDRRMQPIYEGQMEPVTVEGDGAGEAGDGGEFAPPQYDQELLAAVKEYELKLAKADLDCGEELSRIQFEVQSELEEEFIAANEADLERLRDMQQESFG
jgi:hypothetical protein